MTSQLFSDTHCVFARMRVYYGRTCTRFELQGPLVQRHKHRRNANYAKGEPRCFAAREPKLSLFRPLLVPHVPIPVVSQPVLPIAPKFQIISLIVSHGAPAAHRPAYWIFVAYKRRLGGFRAKSSF